VLVSHLDPHHDSMLPELIQNKTRMKVSQVTDAMKVGANRIYVIPPAKELVNQTPVGIFVLTDRLFSYINPAGRELLGMAASDRLIGSRFIDRVDRQFRDRVLAQLDTIRQEQAAATAMEERFLRMDGGSIGCEIFAAPISYKGRQSIVVYARAKNGEAARTGGRQV
jgi:PAS domain S-box-containing protein